MRRVPGSENRAVLSLALLLLRVAFPLDGQAPSLIPNLPGSTEVIAYLNQVIDWHRQMPTEEALATDSADVIFVGNARQIGNQVLQQAFEFAQGRRCPASARFHF